MMDDNVIDELFDTINCLEKENKFFENELANLRLKLEEKKMGDLLKGEKIDANNLINELNKLADQEVSRKLEKIEKNLKNVTIEYIPFDTVDKILIAGDFTKWEQQEMQKIDNKFTFTTPLLKGFKYRYCFFYNGEVLIDFNFPFEENPLTSLINNILYVYSFENNSESKSGMIVDEDLKYFQQESDFQKLEEARHNSYSVSIAKNENEQNVFESIINYSNSLKSQLDSIIKRRDEKFAEKNLQYDMKINRNKDLIDHKYNLYKHKFSGRIMNNNDSLCLIKDINIKDGNIKYVRLYDQYGIKINIDYHEKNSSFEYISLENLIENCFILSKTESEKIINDYKSDTANILRIYYHLIDPFASQDIIMPDNNNESEIRNRKDLHIRRAGRQKEIIPYRILPKNIDINKYNLEISENKIKEVRTKDNNSLVYFEAILIKEEVDKKLNILISTSSLKVFTSLYNKDIVNILHIHLNDTSEEISLDSIFLEKSEDVLKHKNFEIDYRGKKLNYKLLFRDYKLIKIFYNVSAEFIDEPQFEEVRLNKDNIVRIISHDTFSDYFGKVKNIPIGMIARKDKCNNDIIEKFSSSEINKTSYCKERHLEELPGFIDLEIMFDPKMTLIEDPIKISLPVCNVTPLHPKEELAFQKSLIKSQLKKKSQNSENLIKIYKEFQSYEEFIRNPSSLSLINLENAKSLVERLESGINDEEFASSLEDTENVNKLNYVNEIREKLIPMLHQHIRMLFLTNKK